MRYLHAPASFKTLKNSLLLDEPLGYGGLCESEILTRGHRTPEDSQNRKNKVTSGTQSGPNLAGLVSFKDLKQNIV